MTGTPPLRATRRRLLHAPAAVVVAGLAASGCELTDAPDPGGRSPSSSPSGTAATSPEPEADPDETLVARVRQDIAEVAAVVASAGRGRRALRRELAPFARLHRRHLAALPGDDPVTAPERVRGGTAAARRVAQQREEDLRVGLADAAIEADSGPLAALLASMSAAVAQQLAVSEAPA